MSDDYVLFSENLDLSEDPKQRQAEKDWLTKALEADKGTQQRTCNFLKKKMGINLMGSEDWTNFEWGWEEEDALWLYSEENGSIDNVAALVQGFFKHFNYKRVFTLQWAHTCSKPYVGAFGGGVIAVTAETTIAHNTSHVAWLLEIEIKKLERRLKRSKKA
ncbi:MAG: hypothetical protein OK454_03375 [Thaumarchaeota archaeon]|nr:hypothetical protein [Nitrososphaerota archaeon]